MRATSRLTAVWVFLSAVTVLAWWLGGTARGGAHLVSSTPVTMGVLLIAFVKTRLVLRSFMEVATGPRWLRRATDGWLVVFWGAVVATYLL